MAKIVDNLWSPTTDPAPSDHRTIADRVSQQLVDAIVSGDLPQGSKISEPEVARRLGTSRGPLREAIRRLEGLRLVQRQAHVGARVITLSHRELDEVYSVREALEGMAARLAAQHMSEEEVAELGELLARHELMIEQDHDYVQAAGDYDFHYRIIRGSGNRWLIELLTGELYHLIRMYRLTATRSAPRPERALADHRRIADAIAERDGELAEMLMRRHISAARQRIAQRMPEESP
ncbi:MAG: GntR family transcriptional regulator [Gammaproteobacteria bacterium]|jgi:DNA-binding GntR family transcriptional regulator|nr:GntR family transcriptional regulator [Gammaproteobacteria bacterium]